MNRVHLKKKYIIVIILLLVLGLIIFLNTRSREIKYKVNGYQVTEKYHKKIYTLTIDKNNFNYTYKRTNKKKQKKVINKIISNTSNSETCLKITSDLLDTEYICYQDNKLYTINNANLTNKEKLSYQDNLMDLNIKSNKITIHNNLADLYLWNYHGFNKINKDIKNIDLIDNDIYDVNIIYQFKNYILLADYDQEYYFQKMYVYNIKNNKTKTIKFEKDVSFNSIFIGEHDDSLFLLDKKEKKEYEIIPEKAMYRRLNNFIVYHDNKKIKVDFKDLLNEKESFLKSNDVTYKLIDNDLYRIQDKQKILIDQDIKEIIKTDFNTVYYRKGTTLYCFKDNQIIKLITYTEWEFNQNIPIFIY